MEVPPPSRAALSGGSLARPANAPQAGNARSAFEAVRKLNSLQITDREYVVVRDPESHRFMVVVLDQTTGTVIDQFPAESILKMLDQLSPFNTNRAGSTGETLA
jgi:uncharacterized FlaG/YvyC family protein